MESQQNFLSIDTIFRLVVLHLQLNSLNFYQNRMKKSQQILNIAGNSVLFMFLNGQINSKDSSIRSIERTKAKIFMHCGFNYRALLIDYVGFFNPGDLTVVIKPTIPKF